MEASTSESGENTDDGSIEHADESSVAANVGAAIIEMAIQPVVAPSSGGGGGGSSHSKDDEDEDKKRKPRFRR